VNCVLSQQSQLFYHNCQIAASVCACVRVCVCACACWSCSGRIFLIHTKLEGKVVLRLAIGGLEHRPEDIARAWDTITAHC
jgi:hypothetical protein